MMKKIVTLLFVCLTWLSVPAQIVTTDPATFTAEQTATIIFDATNTPLANETKIYAHAGVVTVNKPAPTGTDWSFVKGNWGKDDGIGQLTPVTGQAKKWQLTLSPSVRGYFGVPAGTNIFWLALVFRNADGSKQTSPDIFVPVSNPVFVTLAPIPQTNFVLPNTGISLSATASAAASVFELLIDDGTGFKSIASVTSATTIATEYKPTTSGTVQVKAKATINGTSIEAIQTLTVYIRSATQTADVPAGLRQGINYGNDLTKASLVLLAPQKEFVFVVGDFTNWAISSEYQMKRSADGKTYWIEIAGLEPGREYAFQYWVDGVIQIGDPYSDKVADPYHDEFIPATVYPNLPSYDKRDFGIASVLQTGQTTFPWSATETTWEPPAKSNLVVYELLLRDFLGTHHYTDLIDTLSYLQRLGVNAIELMPIMEFEGNESWGYNPSYFLAPDKYYGTPDELKMFVEAAHEKGMAVILDMVLNHAFGQNPMVKMYFDEATGKPTTSSPWFNPTATHPFSVGFDFNHESSYTKSFVDSVCHYWLSQYHFDGLRFDLSKGFTQKNTGSDVGAWSAFDQSRIDLLSRMAEKIWSYKANAYVILEHFAASAEEDVLAGKGMLLWGNMNNAYQRLLSGDVTADIQSAKRNSHVNYMESHDEERTLTLVENSSSFENAYIISEKNTALNRAKLGAAFFFLVPGPKMMWQFQELGYDKSIQTCRDGSIGDCRLDNKPLPWGASNLGYYEAPERKKVYDVVSALRKLVSTNQEVFQNGTFAWQSTGETRRLQITQGSMDVIVIGNFSTSHKSINAAFTKAGTWYDYFNNQSISVENLATNVKLAPGEFRIYTTVQQPPQKPNLLDIYQPIVTVTPSAFNQAEPVTLVFDATLADPAGTAGLVGANEVFMYSGIVTESYQSETLATTIDGVAGKLTKVSGATDQWQLTFNTDLYYSVPSATRVYRIGLYFKDGTGAKLGKGPQGKIIFLNLLPNPNQPIVRVEPFAFTDTTPIRIIFDASVADKDGTVGLIGASKVYMHSGVITTGPTGTAWENVIGNWGQDDGIGKMTAVVNKPNQWEISITPRSYYNAPAAKSIYRLGMVFRNEDGSRKGKGPGGSDIFVDLDMTTGVLEESDFLQPIFYPNPAKESVYVTTTKSSTVVVRDSLGKIVLRVNGISEKEYAISVADLPSGLYLFEIEAEGKVRQQRVLIHR